MRTEDILNLDCRKEENKSIIQRVLRQIKPLSKCSDEYDIPLTTLEKAISVMCKKYCMMIKDFVPDTLANNQYIIWRAIIVNDTNLHIIDIVYGVSLYEVIAKTVIRLYSEIKNGIEIRK